MGRAVSALFSAFLALGTAPPSTSAHLWSGPAVPAQEVETLSSRGPHDERIEEIRRLRRRIREKKADAQPRASEVDGLESDVKTLVRSVLEAVLPDLDDEDILVRERAAAVLIRLGPESIRDLDRACGEAGRGERLEVQARLEDVIAKLREMDVDEHGRLRQWAADATASTEYGVTNWAARQATGKPDTTRGGDIQTAWASRVPDAGDEWLELSYKEAVHPSLVRLHETYNPGAARRIEARDPEGKWRVLWEGQDTNRECPGWFEVSFAAPRFSTRVIRVTFDSKSVPGWNEIDAVELVGEQASPAPGDER